MKKLAIILLATLLASCTGTTGYWSQFGGGPGLSFASKKHLSGNITKIWDIGYQRMMSMVWPVVDDGFAYAVADDPLDSFSSVLVKLSLETGKKVMDPLPIGKGTSFSLVLGSNSLIISDGPNIKKLDKESFELLWEFQLPDDENVFQFASVEDIVFLVSEKSNVYCLNKETGMARWQQRADEKYFYRWCATNGEISLIEGYEPEGSMKVMAFNSYTGEYLWQFETEGNARIPPQINEKLVIINSTGQIAQLDIENGNLLWTQLVRDASGLPYKIEKPGIFLEDIYYLTIGNRLVGYDTKTGIVIDEKKMPVESTVSGMVASKNTVYISFVGSPYLVCYSIDELKFTKLFEGDRTVIGMAVANGLVVQTIQSVMYFK
jgi:outer membrane protein assembly factor BamB